MGHIKAQFSGDLIAVQGAEIFGRPGVNEWAIMARRVKKDGDSADAKFANADVLPNAEYLAKGGCVCPNCRSLKITTGNCTIDAATAYVSVHCVVCNAEWTDLYRLAGYSDLAAD